MPGSSRPSISASPPRSPPTKATRDRRRAPTRTNVPSDPRPRRTARVTADARCSQVRLRCVLFSMREGCRPEAVEETMKLKLVAVALLGTAGIGALVYSFGGFGAAAAQGPEYLTATASVGDVTADIAATGTLAATSRTAVVFGLDPWIVDDGATAPTSELTFRATEVPATSRRDGQGWRHPRGRGERRSRAPAGDRKERPCFRADQPAHRRGAGRRCPEGCRQRGADQPGQDLAL